MLRALLDSAGRFSDLPPVGYKRSHVNWIIQLSDEGAGANLEGRFRDEIPATIPEVADRSGKVAEGNVKPAFLVDSANYALGLVKPGSIEVESLEHKGFRSIVRRAAAQSGDREFQAVDRFLSAWASKAGVRGPIDSIRQRIESEAKPKDIVAFRVRANRFPFNSEAAKQFWIDYLAQKYVAGTGFCCLCGRHGSVMRILPFGVPVSRGYDPPISSSNERSFDSLGKEQTGNSPVCFECSARASQLLKYLLTNEHHRKVLVRDESRGGAKVPLRNQVAIFWIKESVYTEPLGGDVTFNLEEAFASAIGELRFSGPPAHLGQVAQLLQMPWKRDGSALNLDRNRFYLAVLSPNKSRLVVREWLDVSLEDACRRIQAFDAARAIIDPTGNAVERPTIPDLLNALKPRNSTSWSIDPGLVRGLVRTAYAGCPPPQGLLPAALYRFRIWERANRAGEREEIEFRKMAQAAALKLALTYGREEVETLQSLDTRNRSSAYLCGRLLAILEEAQGRASGWRVGATLVDRFYGSSSTAPAHVLALLLKQATQAHMPKVRRTSRGYLDLEEQLEEVLGGIDESGGYPKFLNVKEQAEFGLGFYHQRACFRANRSAREGAAVEASKERVTGEEKK